MSISFERYEVGDANGVVFRENWSILETVAVILQ